MIKIKKGLDLPIAGKPANSIEDAITVKKVALIGSDYVGMKPSMSVKVGDKVKVGQELFADKKTEGVIYTSPAAGTVIEINRGERRVFQSIVINVESEDHIDFKNYKKKDVSDYSGQEVKDLLLESGNWTAIRQRPYSKVADPQTKPHSIFITAIDTNPLSADPEIIIDENYPAFERGVKALSKLTDGKTYICTGEKSKIALSESNIIKEEFKGPHPAGNVGTHIHFLDPVGGHKTVWHVGYQDVIAIGKLIETGKNYLERIISFAGPQAIKPRYLRTRLGASLEEISAGELKEGETRIISGSVFSGRTAKDAFAYLGRFHNQVSLIKEGGQREFLGWNSIGLNKFSIKNIYLSTFMPSKKYNFDTSTNGSHRSIVPIGAYEKVMPLDIQPTYLLRSLLAKNTEKSQKLGCLELDEEDLALCSFVDPCKNEFGPILRENLAIIEKDG